MCSALAEQRCPAQILATSDALEQGIGLPCHFWCSTSAGLSLRLGLSPDDLVVGLDGAERIRGNATNGVSCVGRSNSSYYAGQRYRRRSFRTGITRLPRGFRSSGLGGPAVRVHLAPDHEGGSSDEVAVQSGVQQQRLTRSCRTGLGLPPSSFARRLRGSCPPLVGKRSGA